MTDTKKEPMTTSGPIVSGCTGACCAVFTLPAVRELAVAHLRFRGGATIASMIRSLGPDEAAERYAILGYGDLPQSVVSSGNLHACVRWDERTRLCRAYDDRPPMCVDYPYDRACSHCGTVDAGSRT